MVMPNAAQAASTPSAVIRPGRKGFLPYSNVTERRSRTAGTPRRLLSRKDQMRSGRKRSPGGLGGRNASRPNPLPASGLDAKRGSAMKAAALQAAATWGDAGAGTAGESVVVTMQSPPVVVGQAASGAQHSSTDAAAQHGAAGPTRGARTRRRRNRPRSAFTGPSLSHRAPMAQGADGREISAASP